METTILRNCSKSFPGLFLPGETTIPGHDLGFEKVLTLMGPFKERLRPSSGNHDTCPESGRLFFIFWGMSAGKYKWLLQLKDLAIGKSCIEQHEVGWGAAAKPSPQLRG
jgi:hypothetical protein